MKIFYQLLAVILSRAGWFVVSADEYHALCMQGCIDNNAMLRFGLRMKRELAHAQEAKK